MGKSCFVVGTTEISWMDHPGLWQKNHRIVNFHCSDIPRDSQTAMTWIGSLKSQRLRWLVLPFSVTTSFKGPNPATLGSSVFSPLSLAHHENPKSVKMHNLTLR